MNYKKILRNLSLVLVLILLVGCGKTDPKLKDGSGIVVSFTNEKYNISADELYEKLKTDYGTSYIIEMMDKEMLDDLYPTDDAINAYVDSQIEMYKQVYGGESELLSQLQNYGYSSIADFKERSLILNYKRELLTKDYLAKNVTEDEIKNYYDNNIIGDITASHILVKVSVDTNASDDEKKKADEEAMTKVKEIYTKLEAGEDFHDLAKEYSDDTANAGNGGRLGTFTYGEMEASFEKAARELKVGEYNKEAVKTSYGYHIILKENEKEKASLETVKQFIIDKLVSNKLSTDTKAQYKALIELRKENGLTINDSDLNSRYDNAVNNWLYGSSN